MKDNPNANDAEHWTVRTNTETVVLDTGYSENHLTAEAALEIADRLEEAAHDLEDVAFIDGSGVEVEFGGDMR